MNLTIVYFKEDVTRQFSTISNRKSETDYLLVNNGLDFNSTARIRGFVDGYRRINKKYQLMELSHPEMSGEVINNTIITTLNNPNVKYISFVDDSSEGANLDSQIALLDKENILAVGTKAKDEKKIDDYVGVPVAYNELVMNSPLVVNDKTWMPAFTVTAPWTINLNIFREGTRQHQMFQIVSTGMNRGFEKEVDFPCFFAHLFMAFRGVMQNNPVLVHEV